MSDESLADEIRRRHDLSSLHLFCQDDPRWRVFGFRASAKGYQASAEQGFGDTISEALAQLDARLTEGPIRRSAP